MSKLSGKKTGSAMLPSLHPLTSAGRRTRTTWRTRSGRRGHGSSGWPAPPASPPPDHPRPPSVGRRSPGRSPAARCRSPASPCDPGGNGGRQREKKSFTQMKKKNISERKKNMHIVCAFVLSSLDKNSGYRANLFSLLQTFVSYCWFGACFICYGSP